MTNETTTETPNDPDDLYPGWTPATDSDGREWSDVIPRDLALDAFLSMTVGTDETEPAGGFSITLLSGGVVVTGTTISRGEWQARTIDELVRAGAGTSLVDGMRLIFDSGDAALKRHHDRREAANAPQNARKHVHLKDATIATPLGAYTRTLWRGSLADVSGWSLGA